MDKPRIFLGSSGKQEKLLQAPKMQFFFETNITPGEYVLICITLWPRLATKWLTTSGVIGQ